MSKQQLQDFLEILDVGDPKQLTVNITSKKTISIKPLSFKQQKSLVTTGLDGFGGVMSFIKTLNDIILHNSEDDSLKIYDRVPIVLALRREMSSKKIIKDEVEIDLSDLLKQFKKFDVVTPPPIEGIGYSISLRVPTLKQENRMLSTCIEDIKKLSDSNIGKNVSLILSYEVPKYIDTITFGEKSLSMDDITMSEKLKILDNLPANVTNQITEFIIRVREYDESLLTFNGVMVDIDSAFFE